MADDTSSAASAETQASGAPADDSAVGKQAVDDPPQDHQEHSADETTAAEPSTDEVTEATDEDAAPTGPTTFEEMGLSDELLRALADMDYIEPMTVQSAVFEAGRDGRDLMVQSRTGTGKTAAFGIPVIARIDGDLKAAQALMLAPTRELALQVARELEKLVQHMPGVHVVPVYGGAAIKPQIDALAAGSQIVVGTPGRVLDHLRRRTFKTDHISMLVLDECDEMLSMGFQEEIENIIAKLPPKEKRQSYLFSATIPPEIQRIGRRHMTDPLELSLSTDGVSVDEIDHFFYVVRGVARTRDLHKILLAEKPHSAIIFCNTREDTNLVTRFLVRQGLDALAISSDLTQRERERVMKRTRDKNLHFLVATDVAARGIDISDLSHVINYTFPESPQVYVHRTGRTGRAGKRGIAISMIGPRDIGAFYYLKLTYKIRPHERELPSNEEYRKIMEGQRCEEIAKMVPEKASETYRSLARTLWESEEGERVVGVLLERLLSKPKAEVVHQERVADVREARDEDDRSGRRRRERGDRDRGGRDRGGRDRDRSRSRRGERDRDENPTDAASPAREEDAGATTASTATSTPTATSTATEGAASDSATGENGERKRRRRRRRRRPGSGDEQAAGSPASGSAPAGDPSKEFWETWADEKSGSSDEAANDEAAAAGEAASEAPKAAAAEPGTVKLYVNVGEREDISEDDVRSLLCEGVEAATAESIRSVKIRNTHTYVRVAEEVADAIIDGCAGKALNERDVVVERAKRR